MKLPKLITGNKFICGLALAVLAFVAAPAAHAQGACPTGGYTGNYATFSISGTCIVNGNIAPSAGSVYFSGSGTLTINGYINSPGAVTLVTTGGTTTVTGTVYAATTGISIEGDNGVSVGSTITANGGQLNIYATASNTGFITLSGATTSQGGVSIEASQDVSLAAVTNTGGGDVRVFANMGGTPTTDPFQIGATNPANGVTSINDSNSSGTGSIYITNGSGAGGITYNGTSSTLSVTTTTGNAGTIVLDGRSTSNITLNGTLSVDNSTGSGVINLFANAITVGTATVTASSPGQNVGDMNLTTNTVTVNTSLTVNMNGNGPTNDAVNFALTPVGSYSINPPDYYLGDPITYGPFSGIQNPLTVTGSGSFTINANGNTNSLKIWGYPLTWTTAATTINQKGSTDSTAFSASDENGNYTTLTWGGTVAIHVNTGSASNTPGQIELFVASIAPLTGNVLLDTSGTSGGGGGTIEVLPVSGSISLGGTGNNFTLNANGSSTGGKAGTIDIGNGGTVAITVNNANAVQASAQSGNANGGTIDISGKTLTNGSGASVAIAANGFGNGNGGTVDLQLGSGAVTFGSAATAFTVNANAATSGSGTGGTVTVKGGNVTITSPVATPAISVVAGNTNGTGGKITVNGSTISMSGGLSATGSGTEPGGVITITSTGNLTLTGTTAVALNASGNATGAPTDTAIIVTAHEAITIGTATGDVQLTAAGSGSSGNGGNVSVTTTSGAITAAGSAISVGPGTSSGNGGTISLNAKTTPTITGTLNANGMGTGNGGTINITGGSSVTITGSQMSVSAGTGTGSNGAGGKISIDGTSIALTGNLTATAATGGTGVGGVIDLTTTTGNLTFSNGSSQSVLNVTGNASGTGSDTAINISAHNAVTLGAASGDVQLIAGGQGSPGNGGSVSVISTSAGITAAGADINVSPAAGGNGTGGSISLNAHTTLIATGSLNANGKGSGLAGTVSLTGNTNNTMTLSGATISAAGDPAGSGTGHTINITNAGPILLAGTTLNANATGPSNNFGGSIQISVPLGDGVDLTQPNTSITATGATNGAGGSVVISYSAGFDVNSIIQVSAGSGVTNTSTFDGSISLNSVPCRQWLTGYVWPTSYWNCVNPASPTATDQIPPSVVNGLPNNIPQNVLKPLDGIFYVQKDATQFNTFFGGSLQASVAGFTFTFGGKTRPVYTSILENVTLGGLGYTSLSQQWLTETTTHESGHSVDIFNNVESGGNAYFNSIVDDLTFLDTLGGGQPCTAGNGTAQGPFVGVTDFQTRQPFCTNGVLNNPNGIYTNPQTGQLYPNHSIAQISSHDLDQVAELNVPITYAEPYAQSFAYQGYAFGESYPNGYYDPTADGLFNKGYFTCAQTHAAFLLGKNFVPTYVYSCN